MDGGGFFRERGPPKSRAHARTMHLTRGAQRQPAIATLPALHVFGGPEFLSIWTWNYIHYFQILSEYCRARPSLLAESTLAAIAANPLIFSPSPPAASQRPSPLSHRNGPSPLPAVRSPGGPARLATLVATSTKKPVPYVVLRVMPFYITRACVSAMTRVLRPKAGPRQSKSHARQSAEVRISGGTAWQIPKNISGNGIRDGSALLLDSLGAKATGRALLLGC